VRKPRAHHTLPTVDIRICTHCNAEVDIESLSESETTWQQWQCCECGSWEDK
jgi:hypothetical protein